MAAACGARSFLNVVVGDYPGYCVVIAKLKFIAACLQSNQLTSTALIPSKLLSCVWDDKQWLNLS